MSFSDPLWNLVSLRHWVWQKHGPFPWKIPVCVVVGLPGAHLGPRPNHSSGPSADSKPQPTPSPPQPILPSAKLTRTHYSRIPDPLCSPHSLPNGGCPHPDCGCSLWRWSETGWGHWGPGGLGGVLTPDPVTCSQPGALLCFLWAKPWVPVLSQRLALGQPAHVAAWGTHTETPSLPWALC